MKRITFLLTLLLLCFAGGVKAQTEITALSQLSNSKVYTVSLYDSGRGTWTYNPSDPTRLYSTSKMGSTVNVFNPNQQFVFLTPDDGTTYYLYSVGAEKFVNYTSDGRASIDTYPVSKVTFASSTGSYTTHPFVVALDGHHVGISNSYSYGVITFWNSTADGGNCIKIFEQSDFSETARTEALARISLGNGAQRNSLLSVISTADDFILKKKFCPALSEKISALKVVVSEAKSLVESSSATADELTAKVTAINNAIAQTYTAFSEISSTQSYYLRHVASGRYLTVVTNGAAEGVKIKSMTSALKDAQLFYVKAVDGVENGFAIQNVNSGKYLAASSSWDFKTQDESFTFIANDAGGLNALMFARNDNTAQFFGPNNGTTSEGAAIYSNHPASDGIYSQWYLELNDEEEAAAIQAAQEKLAAAQTLAMNDAYSLFQSKGLQQDGSNYSSNYASTEEGSLAALVDGVTTTYFHTQYGSATSDDFHHLQIQADMSAQTAVRFISRKRSQNNANRPTTILVQGSANGTDFEDIQTLKNLPSTSDDTTDPYYYSPALDVNGKNYQYIRFVVKATNNGATDASSHPFFTYSEFYLVPDCSEAAAFADILNATYLDDDLDAKVSAVNTAHNGMLSLINYNDLKTLVVTLEGYTTAIGTGLGQYVDNTGNFLTAYSEASTLTSADFNASTDYATPLEALNTAFEGRMQARSGRASRRGVSPTCLQCGELTDGSVPVGSLQGEVEGLFRRVCHLPDGGVFRSHEVFVHSPSQLRQKGVEEVVCVQDDDGLHVKSQLLPRDDFKKFFQRPHPTRECNHRIAHGSHLFLSAVHVRRHHQPCHSFVFPPFFNHEARNHSHRFTTGGETRIRGGSHETGASGAVHQRVAALCQQLTEALRSLHIFFFDFSARGGIYGDGHDGLSKKRV